MVPALAVLVAMSTLWHSSRGSDLVPDGFDVLGIIYQSAVVFGDDVIIDGFSALWTPAGQLKPKTLAGPRDGKPVRAEPGEEGYEIPPALRANDKVLSPTAEKAYPKSRPAEHA